MLSRLVPAAPSACSSVTSEATVDVRGCSRRYGDRAPAGGSGPTCNPGPEVVVLTGCFWVCLQVINNACATQAIVSVLLNCFHSDMSLGDTLTEFREFSQSFDAAVSSPPLPVSPAGSFKKCSGSPGTRVSPRPAADSLILLPSKRRISPPRGIPTATSKRQFCALFYSYLLNTLIMKRPGLMCLWPRRRGSKGVIPEVGHLRPSVRLSVLGSSG